MLKHYITYYPDTDKLKTFRQTWKGKDEIYEEYYVDGKVSLRKEYDGNEWVVREYDNYGNITYYCNSVGLYSRYEYGNYGNVVYFEDNNNSGMNVFKW